MAFYSQIRFILLISFIVIITSFAITSTAPIYFDRTEIAPRQEAANINTEIFEKLLEFRTTTLRILYESYATFTTKSIGTQSSFVRSSILDDILLAYSEFIDTAEKRSTIQDEFSENFTIAVDDIRQTFTEEIDIIFDYLYAVESRIQQIIGLNKISYDASAHIQEEIDRNNTYVQSWLDNRTEYANQIIGTDQAEAIRILNSTILIAQLWSEVQVKAKAELSNLLALSVESFTEEQVGTIRDNLALTLQGINATYTNASTEILNSTEKAFLDPIFLNLIEDIIEDSEIISQNLLDILTLTRDIGRITSSASAGIPGSLGNLVEKLDNLAILLQEDVQRKRQEVSFQKQQTQQTILTVNIVTIIIVAFLIAISSAKIIPPLGDLRKKATMLSQGNLRVDLFNPTGTDELSEVQQAFDMMVLSMKEVIHQGQEVAERVAGISEELAAAAEQASSSVQEVSATVSEISYGASEQTEMVNRVSEQLRELIEYVSEASEKITDAAEFVRKVSKRSNILGLNASIEAAKAGIYGRGFGIVAQSIRELADDTKSRAEEIADLVDTINRTLKQTVEDVARAVERVREVAEENAAGSEEANAASEEQTAMMEEVSSTANELSNLSQELIRVLSKFET